ncbi:hypothetical protein JOB18_042636 [Solea senegalensis]|uniref:Uncharacterized protein n=1 Tax=Solea senegalensis TaxID=28829 RepID=A0AAV6RUZ3_SOLSE|nr:hypothetical protein JOB18_042636 [Solea senegalensis]
MQLRCCCSISASLVVQGNGRHGDIIDRSTLEHPQLHIIEAFWRENEKSVKSCDCNVKPLTGKHRRTTLSAANECCVCREIVQATNPERTDGRTESPGNKQTTATLGLSGEQVEEWSWPTMVLSCCSSLTLRGSLASCATALWP